MRGAQYLCDLRCPAWIRPIVERQRDPPSRGRLPRDELAADGREDRPRACEWCGALRVVRLAACTDRVRREAFEQDQRGDDEQAEAEQSPVGGWPPEAAAATRAQGFFPRPSPWPGAVVVAAVVVVARFACPGAVVDLPGEVVVLV